MAKNVFNGLRKMVEELHQESVGEKPDAPSAYAQQRNPNTCWDDRRYWFQENARLKPQLNVRLGMISAWEKEAKLTGTARSVQSMTDALLSVPIENPETFHQRAAEQAEADVRKHAARLRRAWRRGVSETDWADPSQPDFDQLARQGVTEDTALSYGRNAAASEAHRHGCG